MTDEELVELYETRCAHMEYDGGLSRKEAERAAYFDLRKNVGRDVVMPEEIRSKVRLTEAKPMTAGGSK